MRKLNIFIGLCLGFIGVCIVTAVALFLLTILFEVVGEMIGCIIILSCLIIATIIVSLGDQLEKLGSKITNLFRK